MSAADFLPLQLEDELGEDFANRVAQQVVQQMGPSLEPKTPKEVVAKYFEQRTLKPDTMGTQKSSLGFFVRWCRCWRNR